MYPRMNAGGRSERETNFRAGWNGSRFFCSGCVEFIALAGIHAKGLTGCIRLERIKWIFFWRGVGSSSHALAASAPDTCDWSVAGIHAKG